MIEVYLIISTSPKQRRTKPGTQQRARVKAVKVMEDVADQEYVEVQHVADHEDPALSDSGYASNIWVSYLHTD